MFLLYMFVIYAQYKCKYQMNFPSIRCVYEQTKYCVYLIIKQVVLLINKYQHSVQI